MMRRNRRADPPRLDEYRFTGSPQDHDTISYQRVAKELYELGTIDEAIPSRATSEDRRDENTGLVRDSNSPPASPRSPETAANVDPASRHPPSHASLGSMPLQSISPTSGDAPITQTAAISPIISAMTPFIDVHSYELPPASTVAHHLSVRPPGQTVTSPMTEGINKPTCSLNLMCYRSGSQGCIRRQISVVRKWGGGPPDLIRDDQQFFHALHREYEQHICGFWRRYLSLKTLRQIRLLSYTPTARPEVVPMDDFTLQEVFHAYQHPEKIKTDCEWIDWVFRLRQDDRRHALEFVEGWSGFRIALIGSLPWVVATVVGVAWTARGGDVQTAFTVAAFILTVGTSLLALLAIVSKIES